jgi:hypothetical protein
VQDTILYPFDPKLPPHLDQKMVSASSPSRDVPSGDELDAILNGIDDEDLFDTSNIQPQIPTQATRKTGDVDIGIDEEVKVAKARKPVPKLDEDRFVGYSMHGY